ncbi:fibrillarin-like rRNA/tRNA 2'-O-methyltransferase [Candidatus Woesearchaeota archaeon]|nr:fibrillarin-like rRNA/tRNA 2'-O-methyltransferase [Candidatus Woesearchaeota archaeon]
MSVSPNKFQGVYEVQLGKKRFFATKNLVPGRRVYGEDLVRERDCEYRVWDATRSKIAAALVKGISQIGIYPESKVLYLGASSGTTVSHVSDLVGKDGFVFAVDFAPRSTRDLVFLAQERLNIAPILADANHPGQYLPLLCEVDAVVQDIAQRDQVSIFLKNCRVFLKQGGFGILSVKARSIDVTRKPNLIFKEVRAQLEKNITIVDYRTLDPLEKDHCIFVCKKK